MMIVCQVHLNVIPTHTNSFPANLFVWMKKLVLDNGFVFLLTLPSACSLQKWQVAWMFVSFYSLSVDDLPDLKSVRRSGRNAT